MWGSAQKIESAVSAHKETDETGLVNPTSQDKKSNTSTATVTKTVIGEWKSRGTVYQFGYGGNLRSDEYYGGKLVVWRTGTWSLEENKLTLKYTKYGGSVGRGKMSYAESGTIIWEPDYMSFEVRLDGVNTYFSRQN